jgi:membrane associated rhomboid family serine protease
MSSNAPPPPNPVLSAYENFVRETPLVTRYILMGQAISWILSFLIDFSYAIANTAHFTIFKFELYRIVLSPFVCTSLMSLVFAYISFVDHGRRLEFSQGSTAFAALLLTIAVVTNLAHLAVCFTLYALSGNRGYLFTPSIGIWIILFAVIAIECAKAPQNSMRKLFFFNIPTIYYPLALFCLFSIFGGFQISYILSMAVGYAYG